MAIVRRLVAQENSQDAQWLKVDHNSSYIENHNEDWQFLFGPNSELNTSEQIVKLAGKFNTDTFNSIQFIAYLYDQKNNLVANSSDCVFKIFSIKTPDWTETLIGTFNGTLLSNNYFYINENLSNFPTVSLDSEDSLMVEVSMTRLGVVYRDRVYINHLGVFSSITQLRQNVDFLNITKQDI